MKYSREELTKALCLYGVTDQNWTGEKSLYQQVEEALAGGVSLIQLREKNLSEPAFLKEARKMTSLCHRYKVPLIINDNVEVLLKSNADGIHVGQEDADAAAVRAMIGSERILGVSAHSVKEALAAEKAGADYLGVGAAFSTSTKEDAKAICHDTIREICRSVSIPVVAIGGITEQNLCRLKGLGIKGVALVSAIFGAEEITLTCERLKEKIQDMVKE